MEFINLNRFTHVSALTSDRQFVLALRQREKGECPGDLDIRFTLAPGGPGMSAQAPASLKPVIKYIEDQLTQPGFSGWLCLPYWEGKVEYEPVGRR